MATPAYNAAWRNRGGYGHRGRFGGRGRTWGIVTGNGSMLGGNTPHYLGAGQPTSEDSGSFFGDGTPVYRTAPSTATTPNAVTPPSSTASTATAQPPAPQPGQVAIIVPRS
jgi:hypothetical protein